VPEQEFLPPRPDEDPPPWANMPSVRPTRPRAPAPPPRSGPGAPPAPGGFSGPGGPPGPGGYSGPGGAGAPPPPSRGGGRHGGRISDDYPLGSWQTTGQTGPNPMAPIGPSGPAGPPGAAFLTEPPAGEPYDDQDQPGQAPPWAGPDAEQPDDPRGPSRSSGRAERAAARRRRRWLYLLAALVVVAGAVTSSVVLLTGGPGPASVIPGGLITTFQPGELQQVQNACAVVPAAIVQQYLPGKPKVAAPLPVDGAAESACDWTIDKAPVFRLLQLNLLAYAPSGLASGNGSATSAAIDAYQTTLQDTKSPPPKAANPPAAVTMLPGLGNQAFSAVQVFRSGGSVTDVATVIVRFRNVIVTVTLNGLDHSDRGTYGPVSSSALSAAALAFAQAAEASLH
jgi:hypothetical protein